MPLCQTIGIGDNRFQHRRGTVPDTMARRFAFLLVRDFTLSPLSLFIDTLRLAGDEGDRSRRIEFDWEIVGDRGLPIRASCGVELLPTKGIGNPEDFDNVVVV